MDSRVDGHAPSPTLQRDQDPGREIRARAWAYVFECHEKRKAGVGSTGKEAKEEKHDRPENSVRDRHG